MDSRTMLRALPGLIRPHVPRELGQLRSTTPFSHLVKLYYGNPQIHYEASLHARRHEVEVGLHFESDELTNARLLGAMRARERAIKRRLATARLEEWDRGWARIWEPVAYERLDADLRRALAGRLALYITTLEPVLRDGLPADVEWSLGSSA